MNSDSQQRSNLQRLGDYELVELLAEGPLTRTYRAEQQSIKRTVLVNVLKPAGYAEDEQREAFLADIRAKASIDLPEVATVYEASFEEDTIFYAHQELKGTTLLEMCEAGEQVLKPIDAARILQRISETALTYESRGIATLPFSLSDIYFPEKNLPHLTNRAVAGDPIEGADFQDRALLAEAMMDLMIPGEPASTRMTALTEMMANPAHVPPITWRHVHKLSREVLQQLEDHGISEQTAPPKKETKKNKKTPAAPQSKPSNKPPLRQRESTKPALFGLLAPALFLGAIGGGGFALWKANQQSAIEASPRSVIIAADIFTPEAQKSPTFAAFEIDRFEVTAAEYAAFLRAIAFLPEISKNAFDHPDQPPGKVDHEPLDWPAQLTTPEQPVTGVDWWDAYAYARWKNRALPTLSQFIAASSKRRADSARAGSPADAGGSTTDVQGLTGNVTEWLQPDDTHAGLSAIHFSGSSLSTDYQPDESEDSELSDRSMRSNERGFRTVGAAEPGSRD